MIKFSWYSFAITLCCFACFISFLVGFVVNDFVLASASLLAFTVSIISLMWCVTNAPRK
nr:MAG TPA: hypothetical protein [Caudoviricetes sp.]